MITIILDSSLESDKLKEEASCLRLVVNEILAEDIPEGQEMPIVIIDGEMVVGLEECIEAINIQSYMSVVEKNDSSL